jgi:hypothetical protein
MSRINEDATRLTRRQKRALQPLASGSAPNDVVRELEISLRKLSNWRSLPLFQEELAISARELDAYGRLLQKQALVHPFATLIDTMRSKRAVPRTVVAAAHLALTTWSGHVDDPEWRRALDEDHDTVPDCMRSEKGKREVMDFLDATRDLTPDDEC